MPSQVRPLSTSELETLHTGTLLRRRNALLACEESFEHSDRFQYEQKPTDSNVIEFKNTAEWRQAYIELKAVLAKREHLPAGAERKAMRQARAKR